MQRWRITVRGEGIELRGYIDDYLDDLSIVQEFSKAMKPYGLVMASPADDDYNPFREGGGGVETAPSGRA